MKCAVPLVSIVASILAVDASQRRSTGRNLNTHRRVPGSYKSNTGGKGKGGGSKKSSKGSKSEETYCEYWVWETDSYRKGSRPWYWGTWHDVNENALKNGCHLATITSQEENDKVLAAINSFCENGPPNSCGEPNYDAFWIGGYRELSDADDEWSWVTGEGVGYSNWGTFPRPQPDGGDQTRIFMWGGPESRGTAGTWGDYGPENQFNAVFECCMAYPDSVQINPWYGWNNYYPPGINWTAVL